mgnify:CR=1 FL=1
MKIPIKQILEDIELPSLQTFDTASAQPFVNKAYDEAKNFMHDNMTGKERSTALEAIRQGNRSIAQSTMDPRFLPKMEKHFFGRDTEEDPLAHAQRIQQLQSEDARNHFNAVQAKLKADKFAHEHPTMNFVNQNQGALLAGAGATIGAGYLYNRFRNRG